MVESKTSCWVCNSIDLKIIKHSDAKGQLTSSNFAITNFDYGKTGELQQCKTCGFIQCTDLDHVVNYYEELEDREYENTRQERKLQEQKLIRVLAKYKPDGRLLDIGAGSGIMVEAAIEKGYQAIGIEPSRWLHQNAIKLGLPVVQGIFPHPDVHGPFDIITFVDVIEHVIQPGNLLKDINKVLAEDGIMVLVTPDVRSVAARLLGYKWWHYRFAHIGYFNRKNLSYLLEKTGFQIIKMSRPSWYFTLRYLGIRFLSFFPKFLRFPVPIFFERITIPVNLRDSFLLICTKKLPT
jgi:2-polyprenyl-3-methyl-5-hydroxy-6-metoxy-1,4-benzoquinol methylase